MELWIRSQDKEKLVKCNDIAIKSFLYNEIPEDEWCHSIVGYFDKEAEYEILGSYKTKERALEVLDEIENTIYINKLFNADINAFQKALENEGYTEKEISNALRTISIYQMPKE